MRKFSRTKKIISIFLLTLFMNNILFPYYSWALSSKNQMEYSGYEEAATTDMVNLLTGNFNYNIPLLNVPTPDGKGFSVPLSYHSGLQPDQDASWVGLGWSLNCGAITRNANGYYDDANGTEQLTQRSYSDLNHGYFKNFIVGWKTYDSNMGKGGGVNMSFFGAPNTTVGFGTQSGWSSNGFSQNSGEAVKFDPVDFISSVTSAASYISGPVGVGASIVSSMISIAKMVEPMVNNINNRQNSDFNTEVHNKCGKGNMFHKEWDYCYNTNKIVKPYGALYLGNLGKDGIMNDYAYISNGGNNPVRSNCYHTLLSGNEIVGCSSSDFIRTMNDNAGYCQQLGPTNIAYDNYSVKGEGISGSITPYRLDQGSLAFPAAHYLYHWRMVGNAFVKNDPLLFSDDGTTYTSNYKPQFIYKNQFSNYYNWNDFNNGSISLTTSQVTPGNPKLNTQVNYNDDKFYTSGRRIEPNNNRLDINDIHNAKLTSNKHVIWYTNQEIIDNKFIEPSEKGQFLDCNSSSNNERYIFRNNIGESNQIGGFAVTRPDGYTYHYALPITSKDEVSAWFAYPTDVGQHYGITINPYQFANAWLLTAITGPDFVDKGEVGIVDNNDEGYWVRFEYGKFQSEYKWRYPYVGFKKSEYLGSQSQYSYAKGSTEVYYLNTIRTKSHVALFVKDKTVRKDGKSSFTNNYSYSQPTIVYNSLKLTDIYLFKSSDFDAMGISKINPGSSSIKEIFNNVYDTEDLSFFNNIVTQNQLKHIHFNFQNESGDEYELCKNTFNSYNEDQLNVDASFVNYVSTDYYASHSNVNSWYYLDGGHVINPDVNLDGKLTLQSISVYGLNNTKMFPDYKFEYMGNVEYAPEKTDGWGSFCNTNPYLDKLIPTSNGPFWLLNKVITPMGGELSVNYERDTYSKVCEYPVSGYMTYDDSSPNSLTFDNSLYTYAKPGNTINCHFNRIIGGNPICANLHNGIITKQLTVSSVDNDNHRIVFAESIPSLFQFDTDLIGAPCYNPYVTIDSKVIVTDKIVRYGGDDRVSSIIYKDENSNEYKTKYIYEENGYSNGVCSNEPESVRCNKISRFEAPVLPYSDNRTLLYDFPYTPVIYSKVIMLNGKLTNDNEYEVKTIYNFHPPSIDDISFETNHSQQQGGAQQYIYCQKHNINIKNKIGRIDNQICYNNKTNKISSVYFDYIDDGSSSSYGKIGQFFESTQCFEDLLIRDENNASQNENYVKFTTTQSRQYPSILSQIRTYDEFNNEKRVNNISYDLYTGKANIVEATENGKRIRTEMVPAYKKYSGMGSKTIIPNNRHMLIYPYENYVSLYNQPANRWDMVSADVTEWSKDWTTRNHNGYYTDDIVSSSDNLYRVYKKWVWKGSVDHETGVYLPLGEDWKSDFDYDLTKTENENINNGWLLTGVLSKYNRYSVNTEYYDLNNNFNSKKTDLNDEKIVVSASNSPYICMTHSSFENYIAKGNQGLYEGELIGAFYNQSNYSSQVNSGYQGINSHTGSKFIKIIGGSGPKFRVYSNIVGAIKSGKYRASVWVHEDSPSSTSLVVVYGSGNNYHSELSDSQIEINGWKLLTLDFDVPDSYTGYFNVYVENDNTGTPAYIDDIRVQPIDANVTGYVYNIKDQLIATLDNENIATFYYYDDAGRLKRTDREFPGYGVKKVAEYDYHYARQNE